MRVVFPTDENSGYLSKRGAHFGKAKFYTIITLQEDKIVDVEVVENGGHDSGACGNAVTNIMNLHPDALVVSGIGASPAKGFEEAGLTVYVDTNSPTVDISVKELAANKLTQLAGSGTCSAH